MISDVVDMVEAVKNVGVRVDYIDKVMGEILKARDHQELAHTANLIRERMEVLQRQLDALVVELNQVESEMGD